MKSGGLRMEAGGWLAQSVLECGRPLPLCRRQPKSARGLAQSKTWRSFVTILPLLLSTIISQLSTANAQSYSIDWHTIEGGGGTSTGGVYSVSGSIG
jgi:hypothetical protein